MGAESSVSVTSLNETTTQMLSTCDTVTTSNQKIYAGDVNLNEGCNNNIFILRNKTTATKSCNLQQTLNAMQTMVSSIDVATTAGLWGFSKSTTVQQSTNIIQSFLSEKCSNDDTISQSIDVGNINCKGAQGNLVPLLNEFSSSFACALATTANTNQAADMTAKVTTSGWDPTAGLVQALIACAIIAAIGGAFALVMKTQANKKDAVAAALKLPKPGMV